MFVQTNYALINLDRITSITKPTEDEPHFLIVSDGDYNEITAEEYRHIYEYLKFKGQIILLD